MGGFTGPAHHLVAPAPVAEFAAGRPTTAIWHTDLATTWRIGDPAECYLKLARPPGAILGSHFDPAGEAERLRWAGQWLPVPSVIDTVDAWLLTAALPGINAVTSPHRDQPARTVPALGRALRRFHDTLPVDACPWRFSPAADALTHPDQNVRRLAATAPVAEDIVVCCGDACAPNTLLAADGSVTGYLDLGDLGVGDRWSDLAIALLSLGWNYGSGWDDCFLEAYGIAPDPERIAFHQQLHELT